MAFVKERHDIFIHEGECRMEMREGNQQEREAKLIGFERNIQEIKAKWSEFDKASYIKAKNNRILFAKGISKNVIPTKVGIQQ